MPQSPYDDEETEAQRIADLRASERGESGDEEAGGSESGSGGAGDVARREGFYKPGGSGNSKPSSLSTQANASREKALKDHADSKAEENATNKQPSAFRNKVGQAQQRFGAFQASKRKKQAAIIGIAAGGGLILIAIVVLMVVGSALKLQHFAAQITGYNLAKLSQTFSESAGNVTADEIALKTASDDSAKGLIGGMRESMVARFTKYSPKLLIENMQQEKNIAFNYTVKDRASSTLQTIIGPKQEFSGIRIGEQTVTAADSRFFHPVANIADKMRFSNELDDALARTLSTSNGLVRGVVAKRIRQSLGIELTWWQSAGRKFIGKSDKEAAQIELKETNAKIASKPTTSPVSTVNEAVEAQTGALKDCLDKVECVEQLSKNEIPDTMRKSLVAALKESPLETVVGVINPLYNVAFPLCMIYDGSIENSKDVVNAKNNAAQRSANGLVAAADQQKSGDTTSAAVSATMKRFSDTSNNVPSIRASGKTIDPTLAKALPTPDHSALGMQTLLNVAVGDTVAGLLNGPAHSVCSSLTNTWTALGIGAINVIVFLTSFGTSSGAEELAGQAATKGAEEAAGDVAAQLGAQVAKEGTATIVTEVASKTTFQGIKDGATSFAKKLAWDGAKIATGTLLARELVSAHMSADINGLSQNASAINEADAGMQSHVNEIGRQGFGFRPLSNDEILQNATSQAAYLKSEKEHQSAFARYVSPSNPDSLLATMAVTTSSRLPQLIKQPAAIFSSVLTNVTHGFQITFGTILKANSGVALAADPTLANPYQMVQWGWTRAELDVSKAEETYHPIQNDAVLKQNQSAVDKIEEKYGKCLKSDIGTLVSDTDAGLSSKPPIVRDKAGNITDDSLCSPKRLGIDNDEFGPNMVFRWRLSKLYEGTLDQLTDQQVTVADSDATGASAPTGPLTGDTSNVPCAAGSTSATSVGPDGVVTGHNNSKPVRIRVCSIDSSTGTIVNSAISGSIVQLFTDSAAAGVNFKGSGGFRSYEQQIQARINNHCPDIYTAPASSCTPDTAKPGYSNHEMGLAIDFASGGGTIDRGSSAFNWMVANAAKYGLKNLPSESWHWSVDGT